MDGEATWWASGTVWGCDQNFCLGCSEQRRGQECMAGSQVGELGGRRLNSGGPYCVKRV